MMGLLHPGRMSSEELIFRMRDALARQRLEGWELKFAISIAARARRRNWAPTPKQLGCMRRIVADLRNPQQRFEGEASLIDEDDGGGDG